LTRSAAAFVFCVLFTARSLAFDPGISPNKIVRISELANSQAAQFLLVVLNSSFLALTEVPPMWETLRSETLEGRDALLRSDVIGDFDMMFTSDYEAVRDLFDRGLLRSFFPVFSEEILLVGPDPSGDASEMGAVAVMERIFREGMPFFSLMANEWSIKAEDILWQAAGIDDPGINKNYVQSSRDDVTAMFQAGDEGAFLLVGLGSYAAYRDVQRSSPALEKIAGTGVYKKSYVCLVKNSGFRKDRARTASMLASWLMGVEAGRIVDSFDIAGMTPFRRASPFGENGPGGAP
jgi:ABC-type tungstate transport system permease subunit